VEVDKCRDSVGACQSLMVDQVETKRSEVTSGRHSRCIKADRINSLLKAMHCRRIVSWVLTAGYDGLGGQAPSLHVQGTKSATTRSAARVDYSRSSLQQCAGLAMLRLQGCWSRVYIWADSERSWGCASFLKAVQRRSHCARVGA
jgi:hypothetical protein